MYSKHTFLFPFRWDVKYAGKEPSQTPYSDRTDLATFHRELTGNSSSRWKETTDFTTDTPENYNAWTYLYPFVRKAVFPDGTYNLLRQYRFDGGRDPVYRIHVKKDTVDKRFDLPIIEIVLTVYELGVGVLSFSLSNDRYDESEDILYINDYGRRLYPQFVGASFDLQPTRNSFLANQISISNADGSVAIQSDFSHAYAQSPVYLPPHILQLLNGGQRTAPVFTAEKLAIDKAGVRIEPVLDDRMFVLCWYGNTTLAQAVNTLQGQQYSLTADDDFWYRYVFADTDLTCPDPLLKNDLLKQVTYTRWAPAPHNTLFGISRYSFVMLTDAGWFGQNILSVHLSTIYTRLVLIGLVQRAALLRFSGEVSYISRQLKRTTDITFTSQQVQELNTSYIQFDNRFCFKEITAQEQGIELYDLLQDRMRFSESNAELKREISELNSYVQVANGETQRVSLERLSLLGGLFLVPGFILSYFGWGILDFRHLPINNWGYGLISAAFVALVWIGIRTFFSKPNEFIAKPTDRTRTLLISSIIILLLVSLPVLLSLFVPDKITATQPVIDSTATQKIDSLRTEIQLLRQSLKQSVTAKPISLTR